MARACVQRGLHSQDVEAGDGVPTVYYVHQEEFEDIELFLLPFQLLG